MSVAGIGFVMLFALIFAPPPPQEGIVLTGLGDAIVETRYRFSDVDAKNCDIHPWMQGKVEIVENFA